MLLPTRLRRAGEHGVMPMKYKQIRDKIIENESHKKEMFEWIFYDDVRIWSSLFIDCIFQNCKFTRTSFANDTIFSNCRFNNCRFYGQHTYLGGPSRFDNCDFIECKFKDVQFWDANFSKCTFTGTFKNIVFYGPEAPEGWSTILQDVDFKNVTMELTDFRTGIDLSSTKLPDKA